jgi:hypothetical protein
MYCRVCGQEVSENDRFCSSCGEELQDQQGFMKAPNQNMGPKTYPQNYHLSMVLGILATFFSVLNYLGIFFVHIVGMVLGIIALGMVKKNREENKPYSVVAQVCGSIGLILGAIAMLIGIIYAL